MPLLHLRSEQEKAPSPFFFFERNTGDQLLCLKSSTLEIDTGDQRLCSFYFDSHSFFPGDLLASVRGTCGGLWGGWGRGGAWAGRAG